MCLPLTSGQARWLLICRNVTGEILGQYWGPSLKGLAASTPCLLESSCHVVRKPKQLRGEALVEGSQLLSHVTEPSWKQIPQVPSSHPHPPLPKPHRSDTCCPLQALPRLQICDQIHT